ncbi:hypothetical protein EMPS_07683 [Entomortierella parvispora]|uniref:Crinkler effector protein N-terminal domain-containing protein n=1 Tax=Entomortierella parvispora TaxID=205924 RepID=A0A9P3LYX1_9FUNG|nr:hypothetical protein EMPS_07683 [Entomortierella parvispora]
MAADTLILFCLVSGEPASNAFKVRIVNKDADVDDLKDSIILKKPSAFEHIDANDLIIWRATIPVDKTSEKKCKITIDALENKTELDNPRTRLSEIFPENPDESTYVVVERPKAAISPQTLELEAKMEELLVELEDLRGGKSTVTFNVIVRPNRTESFPWTTDIETATVEKLEKAIYAAHPDREDGDVVVGIIHSSGGNKEYPSDHAHFRDILQQYWRTNIKTLTVVLETPTKKYTDFTLKEVNTLYDISNMDPPNISDLPPFNDISTEALDSDLHKESLRRLLDELDSRIRAIPTDNSSNEATCSAYVCSFLTQAVLIFNGELTLAPERPLRGKNGHGKVDYAIEALAKDGTRHVLGVTEVKHENFKKGLAQNLVQLESSLTVGKRKRSTDDGDDRDGKQEEDNSGPLRAYGIVTDASSWFFVECTIDPSKDSGERPKFGISQLDDIINYKKKTWRAEAESVLGQIVWLMRKMQSEIPVRELRSKKQKFAAPEQSASKMLRV